MQNPLTWLKSTFDEYRQHPKGLFVLFGTEAGERHSFYGTRALLVLYMVSYLFTSNPETIWGYDLMKTALEFVFGKLGVQALSSQIYGLYTALCYLTPFIGGIIADRWIGQRKAVIIGGLIMATGHMVLAFPNTFFLGLLLLVLGNGMFKPNISTQVGALYSGPKDPRYDKAFGIFYQGINLGAMFSPLVCGTLGQNIGWKWGFVAASSVMIMSVMLYLWGQNTLAPDNIAKEKKGTVTRTPLTRDDLIRLVALAVLCLLNIPFWAVYEQQGNTMQLWATNQTVWPTIFGWQIPSTWFQLFNPVMIVIGIPILNQFWGWQAKRNSEPSTVAKMAIGCFLLGSSFLVMVIGANIVGDGRGSLFWPFFCTFILTVGELYLSPMGLSLVNKIAPAQMVSMMMGVWFMATFFGNYLAGFIGSFYEKMPRDVFFMMLMTIGIGAGAVIMAFNKPLKKAMEAKKSDAPIAQPES
jgi:POT family proton-dependent oligopeptide transporter